MVSSRAVFNTLPAASLSMHSDGPSLKINGRSRLAGRVDSASHVASDSNPDGAPPTLVSFVAGLGGRDIADEEFFEMAAVTKRAIDKDETPPPRLLYTEAELREVRKLQAIAHVEYEQLRGASGANEGWRR